MITLAIEGTRSIHSDFLAKCNLTENVFTQDGANRRVWGLEFVFEDGRKVLYDDISTELNHVKMLKSNLIGVSINPEALRDIVEDYVIEIAF